MTKNKEDKPKSNFESQIDLIESKIEKEIERIVSNKKSHNKISNELIKLSKEKLTLQIANKSK